MEEISIKPYASLEEEIDHVRRFLNNEEFRFDGRFTSSFYLDPEVDTSVVIPKRLIHVFVANAFSNGLFNNAGPAHIDLSIHRSGIGILIMVADNGEGQLVEAGTEPSRNEELQLLDSYLPLFNRQQDVSVSYDIVDLAHCEPGETGNRVLITIKN